MTKLRFVDSFDNTESSDPSRDVPNVREIFLDNGRAVKMKRKDPYGLVSFEWDRGAVPAQLDGHYTSFDNARRAFEIYINNNTFATVSETPVEKVPPLPYKKKFRDENGDNIPQVNNG